jgi:di/tricarboxylate transporter
VLDPADAVGDLREVAEICVSTAFCTPFAHESTILVMQPGRYQFKHYLRIGGALALITWLLTTWFTPLVWPFGDAAG